MKVVVRTLTVLGILLVVFVAGTAGLFGWMHEHRPVPVISAEADALAKRMIDAVDGEAWERTGAVAWTTPDGSTHLWDRQRHLDRYTSGDLTVLIDLNSQQGKATRGDIELEGAALKTALETAWAAWCNDAFWFNPVVKAFDDGTTRGTVILEDGRTGLMVSYSSGGVTPGDSYLWILADDGTPEAWKMWVSIIPFGGVDTTWDSWQTLTTGAKISTAHDTELGITIRITNVRGTETLAELEPEDPFYALVGP